VGDNITTDHISPAGAIPPDGPAGHYLLAKGTPPDAFNVFAARRGNFEVMSRCVFTNPKLGNEMVPAGAGPDAPLGRMARYPPSSMWPAAMVPRGCRRVVAGRNFVPDRRGTGGRKAFAALASRAVIAESFERIHRCNLIDMGILPCSSPLERTDDPVLERGREIDLVGLGDGIRPCMGWSARSVAATGRDPGRT
jgi:aconitate hydratase